DCLIPTAECQVRGQDHRALLVAFRHDLEEEVCLLSPERQVSDLVDDEQLRHRYRSMHDLLHAPLALRGLQRDDEVGGRQEADFPALVRGDQPERDGKMRLTGARQDSVTMPGVRRSRSGSTIRFILDAARWCRSRSGGGSQARITWSWFSQTARSLWSRPGWRRQWLALPLSPRALGYRSVGSSSCAH